MKLYQTKENVFSNKHRDRDYVIYREACQKIQSFIAVILKVVFNRGKELFKNYVQFQ